MFKHCSRRLTCLKIHNYPDSIPDWQWLLKEIAEDRCEQCHVERRVIEEFVKDGK